MNYLISILLTGLLLQTPAKDTRVREGFSLTIEPERSTYTAGAPVNIFVIVENISTADIMWTESYPELTYRIQVVDKNGKLVPRTHYGRILRREEEPGPDDVIRFDRHGGGLRPNEKLTRNVNLNVVYRLDEPGDYSVWLCKYVTQSENREVCSNHLTVSLTVRSGTSPNQP